MADVVDGSTIHLVTRPVDPSQQPPQQQGQPNRFFDGLHGGHIPMGFGDGQGGAIPVNMNDIGSVSAASVTRLDTCADTLQALPCRLALNCNLAALSEMLFQGWCTIYALICAVTYENGVFCS